QARTSPGFRDSTVGLLEVDAARNVVGERNVTSAVHYAGISHVEALIRTPQRVHRKRRLWRRSRCAVASGRESAEATNYARSHARLRDARRRLRAASRCALSSLHPDVRARALVITDQPPFVGTGRNRYALEARPCVGRLILVHESALARLKVDSLDNVALVVVVASRYVCDGAVDDDAERHGVARHCGKNRHRRIMRIRALM